VSYDGKYGSRYQDKYFKIIHNPACQTWHNAKPALATAGLCDVAPTNKVHNHVGVIMFYYNYSQVRSMVAV